MQGHGSTSRSYYAEKNQLMAELTDGKWITYVWFGGELVGVSRSGEVSYVHTDHPGRPEFATNASQPTVRRATTMLFSRTTLVGSSYASQRVPSYPSHNLGGRLGRWVDGLLRLCHRLAGILER